MSKHCGRCRLCGRARALCDSHVIPEFLHRSTYGEEGYALKHVQGRWQPKFIQKGLREKLLCVDCEQHLNREFEKPFDDFWRDGELFPTPIPEALSLKTSDPVRFRLFQLSILWRASVAEGPEFATVKLGPYEEEIRAMILNCEAGVFSRHALLARAVTFHGELCSSVISVLGRSRYRGKFVYSLLYAGCNWKFMVGDASPDLLPYAFNERGELRLTRIDLSDLKPVDRFLRAQVNRSQTVALLGARSMNRERS